MFSVVFVRQLVAGAAAICSLAACGSLSNQFGYSGVGIPTPGVITAFYKETDEGFILDQKGRRISVGEYLLASIAYTNENCHRFFESLEAFKQDSRFLDQVLTAAVASGSPILALSSTISARTVANVTSAIAIANQLNKYTADIYAFATFKESLKTHVFDALADFQTKKGLDLLAQSRYGIIVVKSEADGVLTLDLNTEPARTVKIHKARAASFINSTLAMDMLIARTVAADYAAICSLANMRRIVAESLDATKTSANTTGNPAAPTTTKTEGKNAAETR